LAYLKNYMETVKSHLLSTKPDRVEAFETGAQAYAKKIVANFKDFEFYTGESMNSYSMIALLNYRVGQNCAPTLTERLTYRFLFFFFSLTRRMALPVCTVFPACIDVILTADHSLHYVLERWLEGS